MALDDETPRAEMQRHLLRAQPVPESHAWITRGEPLYRRCDRCGAYSHTAQGVQPCPRDPAAPRSDAAHAAELARERLQDEGLDRLARDLGVADPPALVRTHEEVRHPRGRKAPRAAVGLIGSESLLDEMFVEEAKERAQIAYRAGDVPLMNAALHYAQELQRSLEESGAAPFPAHGG